MLTPELTFVRPGQRTLTRLSIHDPLATHPEGHTSSSRRREYKLSRILRQDGLIEISQSRPERFIPHGPRGTSLIHILWTFASLLVAAERTRVIIGRPHLPLALDFEWRLGETALLVPDVDTDDLASAKPTEQLCRVTDHEMPAKAQLPRLWERVQEEVLGSFGLTRDYGYQFDFEAALAAS